MKKNTDTFKQTEIEIQINNALMYSMRPGKIPKGTPDTRLKTLREVSQELIKPLIPFVDGTDEELLMPEELVTVLLAAAAFVQLRYVMGRNDISKTSEEARKNIDTLYGK